MWIHEQIQYHMIECPNCHEDDDLEILDHGSEYTGGGYGNYWYLYKCLKCKHEFKYEKSDFF